MHMSEFVASLEQRCIERLTTSLRAALKRRTSAEGRLAGALAIVAPHSSALLDEMTQALETLLLREQVERPLFKAGVHALLKANAVRGGEFLCRGLLFTEDPHLLVSGRFTKSAELTGTLQRIASKAKAQATFCAELARVSRGESRGARLVEVATRMKESDRLELIERLLLLDEPASPIPAHAWPALRILRDAERHVGRWLAWAELGGALGRDESIKLARQRMERSGRTSRTAWQLACWALSGDGEDLPLRIPSLVQLDRLGGLSACRAAPAFVFRIAEHDVEYARPRLRDLVVDSEPSVQVRARVHLARSGDSESLHWLQRTAEGRGSGTMRALCVGAMFDVTGKPQPAPVELTRGKALEPAVWLGLLALACRGAIGEVLSKRHIGCVERGFAA